VTAPSPSPPPSSPPSPPSSPSEASFPLLTIKKKNYPISIATNTPSLTEYISLLTRHTAPGRRENALSAAYRHLDRSAYWRAECERAKTAYRAAEDARIEALREVDFLKAKLEIARSAGTGAKRKRADADVVPYSREVKKGRKDAQEKREVWLGGIVVEEVMVEEGNGGGESAFLFCFRVLGDGVWLTKNAGQSLMRKLYQIGLYFKPGSPVNAKDLAHHLCSTAAEVARVVVDALEQQKAVESTTSTTLITTLTAAGRVVAGMLAGLQKLDRMDNSDAPRDQVTYALVRMYETLLAAFDTVSKEEALADIPTPATDSRPSTAKPKPKPKGGTVRVNIKDIPSLNALAALLGGILKHLDPKQQPHKEIFEGFLYCILSKLGSRIYTVNFSRPRAASIAKELETADSNTPTPESVTAVRQSHLEAPYLLHLLKLALALTPSFLTHSPAPTSTSTSTSASKTTKSKSTHKSGTITKSTLALAAKERLQATLIEAIFGSEGVDDDELGGLFVDCLRMPVTGGGMAMAAVPRVKEVEVGRWFQGEVWRLLGWEVLGKEMDGKMGGR
jgi:hypothetical protein